MLWNDRSCLRETKPEGRTTDWIADHVKRCRSYNPLKGKSERTGEPILPALHQTCISWGVSA